MYQYCELTAQYWAWKNIHDVEFIGFCHYRRFFNISITPNNIHSLFHDQYAEWLFSILTECEKYIRLSPYARARRVFGYLGEFFMPIFFIHNQCRIKSVKAMDNVGEDTPFNIKECIADFAKDCLHWLMKPYMKKPKSFEEYYLPEVLVGFKQDGIDPREER